MKDSPGSNGADTPLEAPVVSESTQKQQKSRKKSRMLSKRPGKSTGVTARSRGMRVFEASVPPDTLLEALEASTDPKFTTFLHARLDPAYRTLSLARLAQKCGLSLADLDDLYRNHQLHAGMLEMMAHVPEVLKDVALDAKSRVVLCIRCDGEGKLTSEEGRERDCPVCEGGGRVRISGDKNARDLVFETIGLTGKKGPLIAVQHNSANISLDAGLTEVLLSTSKLLTTGNR